jgi:hypothetical protein
MSKEEEGRALLNGDIDPRGAMSQAEQNTRQTLDLENQFTADMAEYLKKGGDLPARVDKKDRHKAMKNLEKGLKQIKFKNSKGENCFDSDQSPLKGVQAQVTLSKVPYKANMWFLTGAEAEVVPRARLLQ